MATVVFSCEGFGFGAAGQLLPIVHSLQHLRGDGFRFVAVGGHTLRALTKGLSLFDKIYSNDTYDETIRALTRCEEENDRIVAIFSSYDPVAILWAYQRGIPNRTVYDGLVAHWQISDYDKLRDLKLSIQSLRDGNVRELIALCQRIDSAGRHHDLQAAMHFFSDISFLCRGVGVETRIKYLKKHGLMPNRSIGVGAIVPNIPSAAYENNSVLVQMSGAGYPIFSLDQERVYFELVRELLVRAINCVKGVARLTVVCPSRYVDMFDIDYFSCSSEVLSSVNPLQNASLIKRHALVISPPGKHTAYDCAAHRRPLIFLPAKHLEQHDVIDHIKRAGYSIPTVSIVDSLGYVANFRDEVSESKALIEEYRKIISSEVKMSRLSGILSSQIERLFVSSGRDITQLTMACEFLIGGFDGRQQIVQYCEGMLAAR